MTEPKPNTKTQRHDALTEAAQAIIDAATARRDAKTARLKAARLAKEMEVEPDRPKRKP